MSSSHSSQFPTTKTTSAEEENKENLISFHLRHFANTTRKGKPLSPFISKLRFLLNGTSKHRNAIHWSSDGRRIVITDVETFKKSVLEDGDTNNKDVMFKTKNFTSFVRQLNLYGFRKVPSNGKSDPTTNMRFEHIHFRKERPDLMQYVQRTCFPSGGSVGSGRRSNRAGVEPLPVRNRSATVSEPRLLPKKTATNPPILYIKGDKERVLVPVVSKTHVSVVGGKQQHTASPLGLSVLRRNIQQTSSSSSANTKMNKKMSVKTTSIVRRQPTSTVMLTPSLAVSSLPNDTTKIISLQNILKTTASHPSNTNIVTSKKAPSSSSSHEHNYALPTITSTKTTILENVGGMSSSEMEDEEVYRFLNNEFNVEKEVVQSLLSLPDSQPKIAEPPAAKYRMTTSTPVEFDDMKPDHVLFTFDNLKTLAEVSSNPLLIQNDDEGDLLLRSESLATPMETVIPSRFL